MQHSHEQDQQREFRQTLQEIQLELLLQFPNLKPQFLQKISSDIEEGIISRSCAGSILRMLQNQK